MAIEADSNAWTGDGGDSKERLRALIQQGAKISGSAAASCIGFLAAGPGGAAALGAVGGLIAESLTAIGEDVAERVLGPREKVRAGGVLALTASRIQDRINRGEQPRSDGFFESRTNDRSAADEFAESVILKAQRESEEKKVTYLANLLTNVAFAPNISLSLAQQLAKTAESLTYRQLVIVATIPFLDKSKVRQSSYRDQQQFPLPLMEVLYEINDLIQRGLVAVEGVATLGLTDIEPRLLKVQGLGVHMHDLMGLNTIPAVELETIGQLLR